MAKAKVVHSDDSCMIILKGNPNTPEPSTVIVKFPGGQVEISRCSDGKKFWAHTYINESAEIVNSRIDYDHEIYSRRDEEGKKPIPKIEDQEHILKIAVQVCGPYESTETL